MEISWCCNKAFQSYFVDAIIILKTDANHKDIGTFYLCDDNYHEEIIEYCPFCGKPLAELLT
jgi:alkyl hydroperoxide reductase subunit AhpF